MNLETAIDVIESVSGFDDESTSVGDAWQTILNHLNPHIGSSFDSYLLEECQEENKQLREAIKQGKSLLIQAKGEIKLHKDNFRALKEEYEPERARRATEKKRRQKLRRKIDSLKEENKQLKEVLNKIANPADEYICESSKTSGGEGAYWICGELAQKALSNT